VRERSAWILMGLVTLALAGLLGLGTGGLTVLVISPLMVVGMAGMGRLLSRPPDAKWLPTIVVLAFVAKLIGAGVRYHFVRNVYHSGDAFGYYRVGMEFANQWRAGTAPPLSGNRGEGTQVMEAIAGFVFAGFKPDFLGGFILFATLSFFGQLGIYAAFRRWARPHQLKPFAILAFFLPSYVFWPSSIGKEAVILLGLGIATYSIARCLERYELRWLIATGLALAGIGLIRIHISALIIGSLFGTAIIARPRAGRGLGTRRLAAIVGILAIGLVAVSQFESRFGTDLLSIQDVDAFSDQVVDRTTTGNVIPGNPVSTPADIPEALVLVLFRPFLWEAEELQIALSALETTFLIGLVVWKSPAIFRNRKQWRSNALVVFSTVYVLAFSIAFSVVRNLGIIARQRTQVLVFFIVIVIALGWEEPGPAMRRQTNQLARGRAQLAPVGVADAREGK